MSGRRCPACGAENEADMPFCLQCGANFPPEGQSLLAGRYQLGEQLGAGGMSDIFRAIDLQNQQPVAVKMLKTERCDDRVGVRRFMLEIAALSKVKHPNLVTILAMGEEPRPYYVMPLSSGPNLADRLEKNGPLPPDEAAAVMLKLLAAVDVLHRDRIIHRDIKAENVMFDAAGEPILLDLGALKDLAATNQVTAFNVIVGSPIAMAPEQILGKKLTVATDIYQLGVLFSEMLLGREPFSGENTMDIMIAHLDKNPTLNTMERQIAPDLVKIALMAMSRDPADRYSNAAKMALAIRAAQGEKLSWWQKVFS